MDRPTAEGGDRTGGGPSAGRRAPEPRAAAGARWAARRRWSAVLAGVSVLAACWTFSASAQTPSDADPPAAPFEPIAAGSKARRSLEQLGALAADGAWDEALDLVDSLTMAGASGEPDGLLPTAESAVGAGSANGSADRGEPWVPVSEALAQALAGWPAEGLAAYRRRVDATAGAWFHRAVDGLDADSLARLVAEIPASSSSDDALAALGELALAHGDTAAARRWWRRLSPLLSGPRGEPIDVALAGIDPAAPAATLAELWLAAPRVGAVGRQPDADLSLAEALARLVVCSIRDGDAPRARIELRLLEGIAPDAKGRLAGADRRLAPALGAMIQELQEPSSPSVAPPVGAIRGWSWRKAVAVAPPASTDPRVAGTRMLQVNPFGQVVIAQAPEPIRGVGPPAIEPAVVGDRVVWTDATGVRAVSLLTGEPAPIEWPSELGGGAVLAAGPARPGGAPPAPAGGRVLLGGRVAAGGVGGVVVLGGGRIIVNGRVAPGFEQAFLDPRQQQGAVAPGASAQTPRGAVVASGTVVYVRASGGLRRRVGGGLALVTGDSLVGVDLARGGKLVFQATPDEPVSEASDAALSAAGGARRFASPPAVRGDRLWVVVAEDELRPRLSLQSYDTATSRRLWSTQLGAGQPRSAGPTSYSSRLVVRGDTAYVATELGAVVAVDANGGAVRWLARYRRRPAEGLGLRFAKAEQPGSLVVHADRVYAAPSDGAELVALDAATGQTLWSTPRDESATLAGVAGGLVLLTGNQVRALQAETGRVRFAWPESMHAGIRGFGAPLVAGGELWWPTRDRLLVLDAATGAMTRPPVDLSPLGDGGANLSAAAGGVLVAGSRGMNLLGPLAAPPGEPGSGVSRSKGWRPRAAGASGPGAEEFSLAHAEPPR